MFGAYACKNKFSHECLFGYSSIKAHSIKANDVIQKIFCPSNPRTKKVIDKQNQDQSTLSLVNNFKKSLLKVL
jgi:hypothetical protein